MSVGNVWVWDFGVSISSNSDPRWELEKFHSLYYCMLGASNELIIKNKHIKNIGNCIRASVRVMSVLESMEKFNYKNFSDDDNAFGTIGRFTVYVDYEATQDNAYIFSSNSDYPDEILIDVRGLHNSRFCHPHLDSDFKE